MELLGTASILTNLCTAISTNAAVRQELFRLALVAINYRIDENKREDFRIALYMMASLMVAVITGACEFTPRC